MEYGADIAESVPAAKLRKLPTVIVSGEPSPAVTRPRIVPAGITS
jgi:hypothetical protein